MTLNLGIIEPYKQGFIEVVVDDYEDRDDGDNTEYWKVKALYLADGEMFEGSSYIYSSSSLALKAGQRLVDWIVDHPREVHLWGCFAFGNQTITRIRGINSIRTENQVKPCYINTIKMFQRLKPLISR